jgi:hypothetical protein
VEKRDGCGGGIGWMRWQFEKANENEQKRLHIAFNIIHQAKAWLL